MKVLMSVKPEFAESIFEGVKRYEYRKQKFKRLDVDKVVLYASLPVQKVVGEFDIREVHIGSPAKIWEETRAHSGITEEYYFNYFEGWRVAYALEVGNVIRYERALCLEEAYGIRPPRSFCYVN